MKVTKNAVVAGVIICFILVFIFMIYLTLLNRSIIKLDDGNIIRQTQRIMEFQNSTEEHFSSTSTPNPPGVYSIGMHVYISGTEGEGLRMREKAGLDEIPLFLGNEGEQFELIDGPELIDNRIWWKLLSLDNYGKEGWAVQDYLSQR